MGKPTFTISSKTRRFRQLGDRGLGEVDKVSQIEYIDLVKRTRGTETSQYLEEKTSTEIPLVVASERGPGQCLIFN